MAWYNKNVVLRTFKVVLDMPWNLNFHQACVLPIKTERKLQFSCVSTLAAAGRVYHFLSKSVDASEDTPVTEQTDVES